MTRMLLQRLFSCGIVFAVLLSVVLAGMAHHAKAEAEPLDPSVQAYLAAGGTLSEICGSLDGDAGAHVECAACVLKSAFALAGVAWAEVSVQQSVSNADLSVVSVFLSKRNFDQSRSARAPPLV